ncbi:MAG: cytidine deaminase [candidate division Zixibacteria bacterium SM23_73_2]|nr:MAG: cytidine deaminase [candidate division Zixibacteria bacterium SM23_73_2]
MRDEELIEKAKKAKEFAHAPYSKFKVGAALLTKNGKLYTGANVENSSYGLSMCAERVTLFCAVSSGEKEFSKLAIVTDSEEPVTPCGACRQTLLEFDGELEIICATTEGKMKIYKLKELLPEPFKFKR